MNYLKNYESVGGIVFNAKAEVIVVNQHGRSWSLPKGHREDGEDRIVTARREIYEEAGVDDLDLIKDLGFYQRYAMDINNQDNLLDLRTIYMFLFKSDTEVLRPTDPENPEARWVSKDKVANLLTHHKDKEFFLKHIHEF